MPSQKSSGVLEAYPALLDEVASEGRANIDRVGQNTSYLYYMHSYSCNLTDFRCRDIWRQRVGFAAQKNISAHTRGYRQL